MFVFPSGAQVNIEVTQDTVDIVRGDNTLFCEELGQIAHDCLAWEQTWPKPE